MLPRNIRWQEVLRHFERKGYVGNGLTLPFLIGFQTVFQPGSSLQSVADFIIDASNSGITVMTCGGIGEFVFGTLDSETDRMRKQYPGMYREFGRLVVTDGSFANCNDLGDIVNTLESKHAGHIRAKTFSKIAGSWQSYSPKDLDRLRELL